MKKNSLSKKVGKIATKENAKKAIKETGGFIAKNKKEVAYVAAGVVGIFLIYKIYKGLSKASAIFDEKIQDVDVNIIVDSTKTTISKEQAQQYARTILDACNAMQPLYGTDEEAIKQVFLKLKTGDDFKKVYKAFGKKDYNGNNSPPSSFIRFLDNYTPRDLIYWLREELSPSDGQVYTIVKNRIESAGYSF
ncbi:hypothetical protein SAMN04489761_4667 [Tenacibaculum sp. MAR_2009_124]|uniref:hypothetical protein n=1 Tax=Tenacibaculum sp. MAR_2009_124 TaxID=1250059 RepID=UPI000895460C|nr:hypothetical protein [Tenacibaculum sp. MAR_2009_124]SED22018.1 hypothetical protein SAMN04489761_4667 [Tenacibaculum sp. MAR_2009_124]